jgi:Protein of unknown function (DUF3072)
MSEDRPVRDVSENPKRDPRPGSNLEKDPSDWVTGDEPMTGAQASDLKTLSEQAREPEAFKTKLSKAEASRRIDALKAKLRLQDEPPHTL